MRRLSLEIGIRSAVRPHWPVRAVLLTPVFTRHALTTTIDENTDSDPVANGKFGHSRPHFGNTSNDLVARHDGKGLRSPVTLDGVNVGVANALEFNVDTNVFGTHVTSKDCVRAKLGRGVKCGVGASGVGHSPSV